MLLELEIENFALVESLRLSFEDGLTALTGETGAGKSIILDSLGFLLGGTTRDGDRESHRSSRVAGRFLVPAPARPLLEEWQFELDGDEVILERELKPSGRSSARINGRMATLANLRDLGAELVDLHGQHQSHSLQRPSRHLELLDRLAGAEHLEAVEEFGRVHRSLRAVAAELEELRAAERERVREIEWLSREVEEIRKAAPMAGEEDALEADIRRLAAAEKLTDGTRLAGELVSGDRGCLDLVAQASKTLTALLGDDPSLEPFAERLAEAEIVLADVGHELFSYSDGLTRDPGLLDELQARAEVLKTLRRKYGATLEEVLEYATASENRLAQLQGADQRIEHLAGEAEALGRRLRAMGEALSGTRRKAASELSAEVLSELAALGMENAVFEVVFETLEEAAPTGLERAEFLLSPNPGSPPKPLARVASGGELSRVMLGLIAVFSRYDPTPTLIFDEIDVGLGGRAAEAVSRKLRELAGASQVLCVTHLALVAAAARQQLRVRKEVQQGVTRVEVDLLADEAREHEIARMLSGDASPEAAFLHARELLKVRA